MTATILRRFGLTFILLSALAAVSLVFIGEMGAQDPDGLPKPKRLQVTTNPGSLNVSVNWDDVDGATHYSVRWRVQGLGNPLNEGVKRSSSDADITVSNHGRWVVRVRACNDTGCGRPTAQQFLVEPAPTPTATPTPEPTSTPTPMPAPEPTPTPTATSQPTPEPTATPQPTTEPTPDTETLRVSIKASPSNPRVRQQTTLSADISNAPSGVRPSFRWEMSYGGSYWFFLDSRSTAAYLASVAESALFRLKVSYDSGASATSDTISVTWSNPTPKPTPEPTPESTATPEPTATPELVTSIPSRPTGLEVSTESGSLEVSVDWDDTKETDSYLVRWRVAGPGNPLNEGVQTQTSDTTIAVEGYGKWVVRVEACNESGCGLGVNRTVIIRQVAPAKPQNLVATTTPGELELSATWDEAARTSRYRLRWRSADGEFESANLVTATHTSADITVSGYGEWVLEALGCNSAGCGPSATTTVEVKPLPTATSTEESARQGYRGQLGEVLVELSLRNHPYASGTQSGAQALASQTTRSATGTSTSTATTTSIVYLIHDASIMDGDFPEVRTALRDVRDTNMSNTKVALIAYGTDWRFVTHFGLTNHSSAPWNVHISEFSGKMGAGTYFSRPLRHAKSLLDADDAAFKKVIHMTNSSFEPCPSQLTRELTDADIVVDTIGFGTFGEIWSGDWGFGCIEKIARETGGRHERVVKPSQGTINDPAVPARALSEILKDSVASSTATLFLVDDSWSVPDWRFLRQHFWAAWHKAAEEDIPDAQLGLAAFVGENPHMETGKVFAGHFRYGPEYFQKYRLGIEIGARIDVIGNEILIAAGMTDIDNALNEAFATISSVTADNKRVVLMSDGISAVDVKDSTLALYSDNSVVLDVVAWGTHADRVLLKSWADATGGMFNVAQ